MNEIAPRQKTKGSEVVNLEKSMEGSDTTEQEHMETTEVITLQLVLYHIHVYAKIIIRFDPRK